MQPSKPDSSLRLPRKCSNVPAESISIHSHMSRIPPRLGPNRVSMRFPLTLYIENTENVRCVPGSGNKSTSGCSDRHRIINLNELFPGNSSKRSITSAASITGRRKDGRFCAFPPAVVSSVTRRFLGCEMQPLGPSHKDGHLQMSASSMAHSVCAGGVMSFMLLLGSCLRISRRRTRCLTRCLQFHFTDGLVLEQHEARARGTVDVCECARVRVCERACVCVYGITPLHSG